MASDHDMMITHTHTHNTLLKEQANTQTVMSFFFQRVLQNKVDTEER